MKRMTNENERIIQQYGHGLCSLLQTIYVVAKSIVYHGSWSVVTRWKLNIRFINMWIYGHLLEFYVLWIEHIDRFGRYTDSMNNIITIENLCHMNAMEITYILYKHGAHAHTMKWNACDVWLPQFPCLKYNDLSFFRSVAFCLGFFFFSFVLFALGKSTLLLLN